MRGHRVSWWSQAQRLGKKPGPCQLQGAVPWVEGRRERQGAAGGYGEGHLHPHDGHRSTTKEPRTWQLPDRGLQPAASANFFGVGGGPRRDLGAVHLFITYVHKSCITNVAMNGKASSLACHANITATY